MARYRLGMIGENDMNALSKDLRQRIFNYALNHSVRKTARAFRVSPNTVHLLKKLWYETGGLEPRPCEAVHAHAVSPEGELFLQALVVEAVDVTLERLCERYEQAYGVRVGVATMHLTLKRMGLTYKKKTFHDPKRDGEGASGIKDSYICQLEGVAPENRVYLDETGSTLNMNLGYGRSPKGERVHDDKPTAPGETVSTAAVLTGHGIEAAAQYRGTLTAKRFISYLEVYVLCLMAGGKVLIMDSHPVHCAKAVQRFLDGRNVPFVFLPPYSPELNPIEEAFSKIKHYIRKCKPRTAETLFDAIRSAIATVTEDDVIGYVNHAEEYL
jgi:transposase